MLKRQTILVVDDEATIREVVRKYLEQEDFLVIEAEAGPEALTLAREKQPDLIVLDIMLPGLDGFAITRSLRDADGHSTLHTSGDIPIIILTARTDEVDRVFGFELGADDYVVKPFSPRELAQRVKAVLRRAAPEASGSGQSISFGDFHLDPRGRTLTKGSKSIDLAATEFDLLWFFARHPRQVFTRAELLTHVWGYEFHGDESTVTVHVRRLREKIEPDPGKPVYIHTVWGVGYKFDAP
jgi:DNA-binding response OmpR family regulator